MENSKHGNTGNKHAKKPAKLLRAARIVIPCDKKLKRAAQGLAKGEGMELAPYMRLLLENAIKAEKYFESIRQG